MLIMALDLAVKMGFAIGDSRDAKPRSGSLRLKDPEDDGSRACRKLGIWMRDQFMVEIPELIVVEAPVNIGAMVDWDSAGETGKPSFRSNPQTISLLHRLVGGVETICGPYAIKCRTANVQTVRKHFVNNARPKDPKRIVLDQCRRIGWVDNDCRDYDRADALALWSYACGEYDNGLAKRRIEK